MLEELLKEFNREQKIEYIRMAQSIFWAMTSRDILEKMDDNKLDDFFIFMYKNTPSGLLETTVNEIRKLGVVSK